MYVKACFLTNVVSWLTDQNPSTHSLQHSFLKTIFKAILSVILNKIALHNKCYNQLNSVFHKIVQSQQYCRYSKD